MNFDNFDLITYLEDRNIDFSPGGKDIGRDWVGIPCVFKPNCSDEGRHLGINKKTKQFSCWICGEKGPITKLIGIIDQANYPKVMDIVKQYQTSFPDYEDDQTPGRPLKREVKSNVKGVLPEEILDHIPEREQRYIQSRNFDPKKIISMYKIKAVYNIGKYRGRIIIPHFQNGRIVTFVARDITGQSDINENHVKYLNCPKEESIVPVNETFYNIDSVRHNKAVLVEGAIDVWRLGPGSIGSCTSNITDIQKTILSKMRLEELFVLYDAEKMAIKKARKIAEELSPFVKRVELITLKNGDPGSMKQDEANAMMIDLLGRNR